MSASRSAVWVMVGSAVPPGSGGVGSMIAPPADRARRAAVRPRRASGIDGRRRPRRPARRAPAARRRRSRRAARGRLGGRPAPAPGGGRATPVGSAARRPPRGRRAWHAMAAVAGGLGRDVGGRPAGGVDWPVVPVSSSTQREPPELEQQHPEVAGVEQLDPDVRVQLAQPAQLAVLLAHELLLERRELDVQVEVGQVEVGREALDDVAVEVPADRERVGLVGPADLVEVEDPGQLRLARVGERRRARAPDPARRVRQPARSAGPSPRPSTSVRRSPVPAGRAGRSIASTSASPTAAGSRGGPRPRVRARGGRRCRAPGSGDPRRRREHEAHGPAAAGGAVELDEGEVAPIREDRDPVDGDGRTARGAAGPGESRPESAMVHGRSV